MLIIHANIQTMEGECFADGFVQINGDKIAAVGTMEDCPPIEGEVLDAEGKRLLPGFVDCHCHLGMWEDSLGFEGDDGNEDSEPVTPHLRAIDAINPMDRAFGEALAAGVTTVLTGPGSANPISGQWVAMKTYGKRIDRMVIDPAVGMKFSLGENPKTAHHEKNQAPTTRMATAALIREQLYKAKDYAAQLEKAQDEDGEQPDYDIKCEALLDVLHAKQKAFFHAHRADDLFTAVRIAKEFQLDAVIVHGTEGHLVPEELAQDHVKLILGPVLCDRSKPELRHLSAAAAGILAKHNIPFAISTDHPEVPIQYLPLSAGLCVREGLDYEVALGAITILPAILCNIDHRVGSIKAGKDADLVLFDGDPLSVYTKPALVIAGGKIVE